MNRIQLLTNSLLAVSQISHIFCCGAPVLFSFITFTANIGALTVLSDLSEQLSFLHHFMHHYEGVIFAIITTLLALAWALHFISLHVSCLDTGCHHHPCDPGKARSYKILWISTVLYGANIVIYFLWAH